MRYGLLNKENPEKIFMFFRNDEASSALLPGEPCCLVMDGTRDGKDVVRATTGAAAKATSLFAGVPPEQINAGEFGMAQVYGFVDNLILVRSTRAGTATGTETSNDFGSGAAIAVGDILNIETAGNGFTRSGAGAASAALPFAVAGETLASFASIDAPDMTTTHIYSGLSRVTNSINAFLRAM